MSKDTAFKIVGPSLKPWSTYLHKLANEPNRDTQIALSAILDRAFAVAKNVNVHVETGRLRESGFVSNSHVRTPRVNRWTGRFSFGRGLKYAKYEFGEVNARRGPRTTWPAHPSHDPMDGLETFYAEIDSVLDALGD